jgi:GNAT superfamily N-acetyltransferase
MAAAAQVNGALSTDSKPLFSSSLISPSVSAALPEGYIIRPLHRSDFQRGFLDVLRVLTTVGEVNAESWDKRYDWMESRPGEYYILCVVDTSREEASSIVGTGTVFVERKFIHELGSVGHIEDIAVAKDQQGKKLGLRIIQALDFVAESVGCYKVRPCSLMIDFEARFWTEADGCTIQVYSGLLRSK